jgi:hypothetical protein
MNVIGKLINIFVRFVVYLLLRVRPSHSRSRIPKRSRIREMYFFQIVISKMIDAFCGYNLD